MLQHRQFNHAVGARNSSRLHEVANRLRRVAATPHPAQRGHARIVPTGYASFLDELAQLALAHHGVGQPEPVEFDLLRRKNPELLDKPVVKRLVIGEFQRTHRVRHLLDRIRLPVREVIHGINAPLVTGPMMLGVQNAVHHRIAHIKVRRTHVDLRPQHA